MNSPQPMQVERSDLHDARLPELRQELRIEPGAVAADGGATWTLIDALQHTYIQIDQTAYHLLSRWQAGMSFSELAEVVRSDLGDVVTVDEVAEFVQFLIANHMVVESAAGGWRRFAELLDHSRLGWFSWLLHNYLYVRLPIFRPEAALKRLLPYVEPIYTRTFAWIVVSSGIAGLYLVSRQWDAFYHTFQYFFSWQGAVAYALALTFIKSAHELGHGFTAARFGCRVPSMGVCLLVMFPVLYTDVTDAWRLRDRRSRLIIGAAGVAVELSIACLATLAWSFLPDGILRSTAFFLATVAWVLSIAVNFNPLMRFDGYYLFSDFIGIDNLQTRAFAFGRWKLREILFGLGRQAPEALPEKTGLILIAYAWCVWLYRLIVFTGIAVLVYHFAFKALGIILFAVEIFYFVLGPVLREFRRWWAEGGSISATQRTRITVLCTVLGILILSVPWSRKVSVPAVIETSQLARVYPKSAGLVESVLVRIGDSVRAGDPLVQLQSYEIDQQLELTNRKIDLVRLRLARRMSDAEDRTTSLVLEQELRALIETRDGLGKEKANLTLVAPISGRIAEFNSAVQPNRTISRREFVALIQGGNGLVARGYISEDEVRRVGQGTMGRFIPDEPHWPSVPVVVSEISAAGAASIDILELASVHGGPIAVRPQNVQGNGTKSIPVKASYLATFTAGSAVAHNFSLRGVVVLEGSAESFLGRGLRRAAAVLVRESGF
ncbi:MAG: efflux RND transporter periplasmic adaptor subunit [Hyphomicrobiaceae bacterium]|nr:efflux RND transporter periplasmic adaptor subunit [Hyphomicrobiaceae bacterium]